MRKFKDGEIYKLKYGGVCIYSKKYDGFSPIFYGYFNYYGDFVKSDAKKATNEDIKNELSLTVSIIMMKLFREKQLMEYENFTRNL